MKKNLSMLLILICTMSQSVCAAKVEVKTEYYPDGSLHYEREYENGVRNGFAKSYHPNGKLHQEVMYEQGKKQGQLKQYRTDGSLEQIFTYQNDKVHGLVQKYHPDGKLAHEHNWANNAPDGKGVKTFDYYSNGTLKKEYAYYLGDGYSMEYHSNGKMWRQFDIKKARIQNYREFDRLGLTVLDKRGLYSGVIKEYNLRGEFIRAGHYRKGKLVAVADKDGASILSDGE